MTLTVEVRRGSTTILNSGAQRMCDIQNRKFLIYTNAGALHLWLEEFRPGLLGSPSDFSIDGITNRQHTTTALEGGDSAFTVRITVSRQRWLTNQPTVEFLDAYVDQSFTRSYSIVKSDLAAICLSYGRVTRRMLEPQAEALWQQERLKAADSQYVPSPKHAFEGTAAYLMGMSYLERCSRFDPLNQNWHKVRTLTSFAIGLAKFREVLDGGAKKTQPGVDFVFGPFTIGANGTFRPDRNENHWHSFQDYFWMNAAAGSAQEHAVINQAFGEQYAISTVKLLQLAQSRSGPSQAGIVVLDVNNYASRGNQASTGYGSTVLSNYDSGVWQDVIDAFQTDGGYARVFITPASITSDSGKYKGMGALVVGPHYGSGSFISGNQNGGYGSVFDDVTPAANTYYTPFTTTFSPAGDVNFAYYSPAAYLIVQDNSPSVTPLFFNSDFNVLATPDQNTAFDSWKEPQNLTGQTYNTGKLVNEEGGTMGLASFLRGVYTRAEDPVDTVTGAFYVDAVDLQLPGPMPLEVRRNYSSHNRSRNQLGHGWKLNYMPQLLLRTNSANKEIIDGAEADGSVIAYRKTNSIWVPFPEENPTLSTHTMRGTGSRANLFNARIEKLNTNGADHYYLYSPDGSVRDFKVTSYPITNGTHRLQRTRPYLQTWRDHRGNAYTFLYESDPTKLEYGQVCRVEASNGNFLGFRYDTHARIIEAFTGDGRRLYYEYDQYGDLVKVTLPDATERKYEYKQYAFNWTNENNQVNLAFDSEHLLLRSRTPDGRVLRNEYDDKRRVTNQFSTVGADLVPVRNATFAYSNNFNINKAHTNMVTGYTLITDVNNNVTRYEYTNGLITKIIDPLNQTNIQEWYYTGNEETGAYRRSLKSETDKRGLKTSYKYDANGNVTNTIVTGDLTGNGTLSETATNTFAYNTNNILTETVDPSGRKTEIRYHAQFQFLPEQAIASANGVIVSTNFFEYYNVTNTVTNGTLIITNLALGVGRREIRAYGSADAATNEWVRDGRGFATSQIQYPGTGDPNVTNSFFYDARGQLTEKTDAAGRKTRYDYDGLGRLKWTEVLDETGKQLSGAYTYYNANGEPEWVDGPRYDPQDYAFMDYDGGGRQTTQIRWRTQAKADGSGVEAAPGYDQFATTYQQWDGFGNLIKVIDPRGSILTNAYDALGQKIMAQALDANGAVLRTERFKYEPGGQITLQTNALGGVTQILYTSLGKPRYQKNPDGSTNQSRYYLDGRAQREIQPNNAYWETTYDDQNRRVTRKFYSAGGTALATNTTEFDRRGNLVRSVDVAGFAFTNNYDGLDRVKWTAGPVVSPVRPPGAPDFPPLPPSVQQAVTNYFDASGSVTTNLNAAGHKAITRTDALGRITRFEQYRNGVLERESTTTYADNHHSVTVTNSSGANATATTAYTDTFGNPVLSIGYPAASVRHFTRSVYDVAGNLTSQIQASVTNTTLVEWASASTTYDSLNRAMSKTERDGAVTTFQYDPAGNLTNRVSPGSLALRATYNTAGQKTQDYILGSAGAAGTRTNTYTYSSIGLLASRTDNRGVVCDYVYDDWMRPLTNTHSGPLDEQDIITSFKYDPRGLLTNITEQFANPVTGPATTIRRSHNAYGQLKDESVYFNSAVLYSTMQDFDAAGHRSSVGYGFGQFGFGTSVRSDGAISSFAGPTGTGQYNYDTAGRLVLRNIMPYASGGQRVTVTGQRDGMGRPLSITNTLSGSVKLLETLTWTGDGLLASHTIGRAGDFTNSMQFIHASQTRRLIEERLDLSATKRHTNTFTFDTAQAAGPGVLTKAVAANAISATWSGGADALSRISAETNNTIQRLAYGAVNGPATVSALLDGQPMPVTLSGTQALRWLANLELAPGAHQLRAEARHPSGMYTGYATNWFTNSVGSLTASDTYDGTGNITQRLWKNPNGTTNRTLTLSWDGRGRLWQAIDRDSTQSGKNWAALYDALGRLLRTTELTITNGITNLAYVTTIDHYYDPQYEFLEIGVSENGHTTWKVMGPDLDGRYGSQNGTGGFEAIVPGPELFCPILSDFRGNLHSVYDVDHATNMWYPSRVSAYGGVVGYRPVPLGHPSSELGSKCAWRNRWTTSFGFVYLGANWVCLDSCQFASFDQTAFGAGDSPGYVFCMGNPGDYWDPDGRLAAGFNAGWNSGSSPAGSSGAFNAAYLIGGVLNGGAEGTGEGAAILANTATFGQVNSLNGYANGLQGPVYDASRTLATVGLTSLALAGAWAALESPAVYNAVTTVAHNPWTAVGLSAAANGAYTYSEGGSAGQVATATVTGAALTYLNNPFPIGGQNAPPTQPSPSPTSVRDQVLANITANRAATANIDRGLTTMDLRALTTITAGEVDALGANAFTAAQQNAVANYPNLLNAYRGSTIDARVRTAVDQDPRLTWLQGAPNRGPDFVSPLTGQWWDMTTPAQWQSHVNKYGPGGTLLPTKP